MIVKEMKINELRSMKTIKNNEVFGELKIDTDTYRIYLDEESKEVNCSFYDEENLEWYTETYDFKHYESLEGLL